MVTVHDVIIREFHKVLMEGEKGSLAQGFPVGGGDTPAAALRTPMLNQDTRGMSMRFRNRPETGTQH